jgi:GGDEF domain-containing protein
MENDSLVVLMDLDNFKEISTSQGWTKYSPNIITGNLTELVRKLIRNHFGTIVHGLNQEEGTEECMIVFTAPNFNDLLNDLEEIRREIEKYGKESRTNATISIGVARGRVFDMKPARSRKKEHLYNDSIRALAKKALNEAKKKNGNKIIIK